MRVYEKRSFVKERCMQAREIANNQCGSTSNELKQPADCAASPKTVLALSGTLLVNGESFDLNPDYHLQAD
jgi:hypothetical protein